TTVYADMPIGDPSQFNATLAAAGLQAPPQPAPGAPPPSAEIGVPYGAVPMRPLAPIAPAAPVQVLPPEQTPPVTSARVAKLSDEPPPEIAAEHRKQTKEKGDRESAEGAIFAKPGEGGISGPPRPTIVPAHAISKVSPKTRALEEEGLELERRGALE